MTLHVLYTWCLANLFNPAMYVVGIWIMNGEVNWHGSIDSLGFYIIACIYSLALSSPSFFLAAGLLYFMMRLKLSLYVLLGGWLLISALVIIINVGGIFSAFGEPASITVLYLAVPPTAATWLAIAIRWKQFHKLINRSDPGSLIE